MSAQVLMTSVTTNYRLVKIETVEVESHCGYTEGGKPNANHGPSSKKEMEAAAVVKARVLKTTSEVAVGCNDVVSLSS